MSAGTVRFEQKTYGTQNARKKCGWSGKDFSAEVRRELGGGNSRRAPAEKAKLASLFQAELDQFYARSEPEMARLILSIAARVCRQELAVNREGVLQWVREGLSVLGDDGPRTVRVQPRGRGRRAGAHRNRGGGGEDGLLVFWLRGT